MSHFTTIETQIKDLEVLAEACRELGVELQSEVVCRGYGGISRTAHRVIRLQGPYDIAVDPSSKIPGAYDLTTDWWGGHVERETGMGFGRLLQSYAVCQTLRQAKLRGLRVYRQNEESGNVLLILEGGSL